jgi:hypothetical protein
VIIFRSQKGSASTNVWKAPLVRVFEHEDGGVPLKYVEVNKLLYYWVCYMRIYWFYKWEKPVTNILNCRTAADCTILLERFTRKIPKCLFRTERLVFRKTKRRSAINTHYILHTYIQHYETSERRSKILQKTSSILRGIGLLLYLGLTLHRPLAISRSDPS